MMVAEILLLGMDPFVNGVCCVNLNVSVQIIFLTKIFKIEFRVGGTIGGWFQY